MTKPLIFGHRGAPAVVPENTLAGFQHTLGAGADGIELDVLLTRDGVPVVTHNPRLLADTTKGPNGDWLTGTGPEIASLSLAELQSYDVGGCHPDGPHARKHPQQKPLGFTAIPTLDAVLALVASHEQDTQVLVELKHAPDSTLAPEVFVETVADCVVKHGLLQQSYVHAFNWKILAAAGKIIPEWKRSHLCCSRNRYADGSWYEGSPWLDGLSNDTSVMLPQLAERGASNWSPYHKDLTADSLDLAHTLGLSVMTWTVTRPKDLTLELLRGVDGIVTDDPSTAVGLRDTRG